MTGMKRFLVAFACSGLLISCASERESAISLKTGMWRATIDIQGHDLPFNFELAKDTQGGYDIFLRNAGERLLLDEVSVKHDSIDITLHIFDANIKAKIEGDSLKGLFIKNYEKDYKIPFKAAYGQSFRFERPETQTSIPDFTGKYSVTFLHEKDTTLAIGIFAQQGDSVTGT